MIDASLPDNSLQNHQKINGDQNQLIGQVYGGIIVYVSGGQAIINPPSIESPQPDDQNWEIGENPYKGLLSFKEADSDKFFGRSRDIKYLWKQFRDLQHQEIRLMPVFGPSGSGKSSLVRAGLIPELGQQPIPGKEKARIAVLVPGDDPLYSLAMVLARISTNDNNPVEKADEFKCVLKNKDDEGKFTGLKRIAYGLRDIATLPLIVLIDQFEEVYSLCQDEQERDATISNLLYAASNKSRYVSVILTMRSDFLGETQKHPTLNRLFSSPGFLVPTMDADCLRAAISTPAENAKHPLDNATVDLLIYQTQGREGALPLLQFALSQIWEGLRERKEPSVTLKEIGGIGGALAGEAQRIYEKLSTEDRQIARRIFLGLVQLGEGVKDTRRRTEIKNFVSQRSSQEQVKNVIAKFADPSTRLITLAVNEDIETAEVTHEALFDNWQELKTWLDNSRGDLRFQRRLEEAAKYWDSHGRPNGCLWRPPDLNLLKDYYQKSVMEMSALQVQFFRASERSQKNYKRLLMFGYFLVGAGALLYVGSNRIYNKYASCSVEEGVVGEKIENLCFRSLSTSGDKIVFLSRNNFYIKEGAKAFKEANKLDLQNNKYRHNEYLQLAKDLFDNVLNLKNNKYQKEKYQAAKNLFETAISSDSTDPVAQIYLNNTKARLKGNPLKVAVVVSIDSYQEAAKEVLRGIADAQDEFNKDNNKNPRLLEIVIVNDGNEQIIAEKVAKELANDSSILAIIGHHASESTLKALPIYQKYNIAVISPTSSSSHLKSPVFFRTISSTKEAASKYTSYINKHLNLDKIAIAYTPGSEYSETLKKDLEKDLNNKGIEIFRDDIKLDKTLKVSNEINKLVKNKVKGVLLISNVSTNSIVIAIAKENFKHKKSERVTLLSAMALSEGSTLKTGGEAIKGLVLASPCLNKHSSYMEKAQTRWGQKIYWRVATSYDATRVLIEAIKRSSKDPERQEILKNLKLTSLPKDRTSGFGVRWLSSDDRSNSLSKYCMFKIERGEFKEKRGEFKEIFEK